MDKSSMLVMDLYAAGSCLKTQLTERTFVMPPTRTPSQFQSAKTLAFNQHPAMGILFGPIRGYSFKQNAHFV